MNNEIKLIGRFSIIAMFVAIGCVAKPVSPSQTNPINAIPSAQLQTGAQQLDLLLPHLIGKRVALVVNQTATIHKTHLVDTLLKRQVNILRIFGPEHGFRGESPDGAIINDSIDIQTRISIASLYGKNKKPNQHQLQDVDVIVFDIQDVGTRFYTYISTMHYVMEACAENNKQLIILDRPNPNGAYVDGPLLQPAFKSFVGMHPIPIVHGLTVGELALMINGEGWLGENKKCTLEIIKLKNWKHSDRYSLPVKPSPNLPNDQAIRLYPSLCLFEGTVISVGRGTQIPFQVLGNPLLKNMPYQFTPVSIMGMSTNPPLQNQLCYGLDLRNVEVKPKLDLSYLLLFYKAYPEKDKFFITSFDRLAGTDQLRKQIQEGLSEEQIRASWNKDLEQFKMMRKKYLLYE